MTNSHDLVPVAEGFLVFFQKLKKSCLIFASPNHWNKKSIYIFFSACYASARPVGMADFCCPAVELLKWSSQPDCSGTQHWVWLGKVLADLPNFSHLTLAGMYVIHLLPYTVDGPNPADVDNMSTGFFGINCPASFFLTGLHYVLLRGFWTSSQYGIKMMDFFSLFVAMSKWNIIHKACRWSLPSRNHFLRIHSSHLFFGNLYPSLTPPNFDNVEVLWSGVKHLSSLGVPCSSIVDESDATKIELRSKLRFQVPRYIGLVGGNLFFVQKGSNLHRLEVSIRFCGWWFCGSCTKDFEPCDVVPFFKQMWLFPWSFTSLFLLAFENPEEGEVQKHWRQSPVRLVDIGGPDQKTNAAYLATGSQVRLPSSWRGVGGHSTQFGTQLRCGCWVCLNVIFFWGVELGDKVGCLCFLKVRLWGKRGPFDAGRSWIPFFFIWLAWTLFLGFLGTSSLFLKNK